MLSVLPHTFPTSKEKAEIRPVRFHWQAASLEENEESGILWHGPLNGTSGSGSAGATAVV